MGYNIVKSDVNNVDVELITPHEQDMLRDVGSAQTSNAFGPFASARLAS